MRTVYALVIACVLLLPFPVPAGGVFALLPAVHAAPPRQPPPETVARDWVQTTAADFAVGDRVGIEVTDLEGGELRLAAGEMAGTYVSPAIAADFVFSAIVARWSASVPQGATLEVDLRSYTEASGWSSWQPLVNVEWFAPRGEYYPEAPLMVSAGWQFQYRVTMGAGSDGVGVAETPVLQRVTITYLDTRIGPTTAQAKMVIRAQDLTPHGVLQPPIISRAGWGADESYRTWEPEVVPVSKMVVHHTVTPNDYAEDQGAVWMRAIYYYHAVTLGWGDIGYNYLVDRYGNIYEGRYGGPGVVGGHVYSYNDGSVGIALLGTHGNTGGSEAPTPAALDALARLGVWEASRSYIHPLQSVPFDGAATPNLGGHRDYPPQRTTCPGDLGYAALPGLRQSVWKGLVAALPQYEVAWLDWDTASEAWNEGVVTAGQVYSLTISVRNTGWYTWTHAGMRNVVRLGYHWLDSSGQPVVQPPSDDLRTPIAQDVAYGQTYEFPSARVVAPRTAGSYTLAWDMVHEGVTWYHDANAESPLLVMPMSVVGAPLGEYGAIRNGGFEQEGNWTLFETPYSARYTRQVRWKGERALQTGIEEGAGNVFSFSSAEQAVRVPATGDRALRYWHRAQINEADFCYVYLRPEGGLWRLLQIVRRNVPEWREVVHDLSAYADRQIALRFGCFNNGLGDVSAMYVDEVSLGVGAAPDPMPQPSPCTELTVNGGFETDEGWVIYDTPRDARYTTALARTGNRSMQLGIAEPAENAFSYSSAAQRFSIPEGQRATLGLWYNVPQGGGRGDYGYLLIRPGGGSWITLRIVRDTTDGWVQLQEDVSHLAGRAFTLRLGMRNDGEAEVAAMYVDDVTLEACSP